MSSARVPADTWILDELGFVPFDSAGGELFFKLLTERYKRRSVIVTTNLAFGEWVKVFGGDEKLTTALLDCLAHYATVIATKGKSFRMRKEAVSDTATDHWGRGRRLAQDRPEGVGIEPRVDQFPIGDLDQFPTGASRSLAHRNSD